MGRKAVKKLTEVEKKELNDLLFLDTGTDSSGLVAVGLRGAIAGDVHTNKIIRIKELLAKI